MKIQVRSQIKPKRVDWSSENSCLFFNERHGDKKLFLSYVPFLPSLKSHIWLATSGRAQQKWVAISKKALLISAKAVNRHLKATAKDRWGLCLPLFHVGGLAITARAYLSKSLYFTYKDKWSAQTFCRFLKENQVTLSALVPAQVYDIVRSGYKAPPSLRAVVVGGEHLSLSLYQQARDLKWPLLPSYGLTECGSQVATAKLNSLAVNACHKDSLPPLKILSHVQVKTIKGEIALKSLSLFTGFVPLSFSNKPPRKGHREGALFPQTAKKGVLQDPKQKGWYKTGDKGILKETFLQVDPSAHIKILGEKINMLRLKEIFMSLLLKNSFSQKVFLVPLPSQRDGWQIALVAEAFEKQALACLLKEFNQKVSPFEKIKAVYIVPHIPLTSLSKLRLSALFKILGFPPCGNK